MEIIIFLLVAAVLLLLVSGIYTFVLACVRTKDHPWLEPAALQKTPYGRFSDHIQKAHQWLENHETQEVSITSDDGLTLKGIWVPAKKPRGTVLMAHGYHSCFLVDFGLSYDFYHNMGMNLLLPYQRSHGKSQGKYVTFGVKESADMV